MSQASTFASGSTTIALSRPRPRTCKHTQVRSGAGQRGRPVQAGILEGEARRASSHPRSQPPAPPRSPQELARIPTPTHPAPQAPTHLLDERRADVAQRLAEDGAQPLRVLRALLLHQHLQSRGEGRKGFAKKGGRKQVCAAAVWEVQRHAGAGTWALPNTKPTLPVSCRQIPRIPLLLCAQCIPASAQPTSPLPPPSGTCSEAMATRAATGLPPYVEPCWPRPIVSMTCSSRSGGVALKHRQESNGTLAAARAASWPAAAARRRKPEFPMEMWGPVACALCVQTALPPPPHPTPPHTHMRTSSLASTAETGSVPPDSALPSTVMSGLTPSHSLHSILPVLRGGTKRGPSWSRLVSGRVGTHS
jgi:hypothetical protein